MTRKKKTTKMALIFSVTLTLSVFLFIQIASAQNTNNSDCTADVVFCIDNSGSIRDNDPPGGNNWLECLNFVSALVQQFNVGPDQTRVGCVTFGEKGYLSMALNEYQTNADVVNAVMQLRYRGENTNTTGGLYWSRKVLTEEIYGARVGLAKVIILLTDGKPTYDSDKLDDEVKIIKGLGIRLLTIGITNQINETLLRSMATNPDDYIYGGAVFKDLDMIKNSVINNNTCVAIQNTTRQEHTVAATLPTTTAPTTTTTTPTTTVPTPPPLLQACPASADIIFAVDASGSIGHSNYEKLKTFLAGVVMGLDVETRKMQVGVATFSTAAEPQFNLNAYSGRLQLELAIQNLPYSGGSRNTAAALQYICTTMFTPRAGDRPKIPNILILITNGASINQTLTLIQASLCRTEGNRIITVGIGTWLSVYELENTASWPYSVNSLSASGFKGFTPSLVNQLTDLICNSGNPCSSGSNPCGNGQCIPTGNNGYSCTCGNGLSGVQCQISCRQTADVIFLIDASTSYGTVNFQKQLDFVRDVTNGLNLQLNGAGGTGVGVIVFSDTAFVQCQLGQYTDRQALLDCISTPYTGGSTNLADAISLARNMFATQGVPGKPRICVVFIDGQSNNINATIQQASLARQESITMIVVSVGSYTLMSELSVIASNPTSANILNVTNCGSFASIKTPLLAALCNDVNECDMNPCRNGGNCVDLINGYRCTCRSTYTGINCQRACSGKVDIVFVIDASGSIRIERFPKVTQFITNVISQLEIGPQKTQIGAVSYSDSATAQFMLNTYNNAQDINIHISRMKFLGGKTNTASALTVMKDQMFQPGSGDRADAPNFAIVLTDGRSNINEQDTIKIAVAAKNIGIAIVTFAVGTDINVAELTNIASEPYSSNILNVSSWTLLPSILNPMIMSVCDDFNMCSSSPCLHGGTCQRSVQMFQCLCAQSWAGLTCNRSCPAQLDVVLVLDISGSVEEVYHMVIAFAKQIVYGLPIGANLTRISVITFSDNATIAFDLNTYSSPLLVRNAMAFDNSGGRTNTQAAITLAYQTEFTTARGDRSSAPDVMIVVSDGQSNVAANNTIPAANAARSQNILIFAVGVGPDIDEAEITGIASTTTRPIFVPDSTDVLTKASQLLDQLCSLK